MILPVDPMAWVGQLGSGTRGTSLEHDVLLSVSDDGELAFWVPGDDSGERTKAVDGHSANVLNGAGTSGWACTGKVRTGRKGVRIAGCSSAKKSVLGRCPPTTLDSVYLCMARIQSLKYPKGKSSLSGTRRSPSSLSASSIVRHSGMHETSHAPAAAAQINFAARRTQSTTWIGRLLRTSSPSLPLASRTGSSCSASSGQHTSTKPQHGASAGESTCPQ